MTLDKPTHKSPKTADDGVGLLGNQSNTTSMTFSSSMSIPSNLRFNSSCADICVNFKRGSATVLYKNSNKVYRYFNVSRRAILNFIMQPNMSVGFWINQNLINAKRVECFS